METTQATSKKQSPHIELVPAATDQQPILANLLELYAHDFSEFHSVELGADGRFGYKHLSLYWSEPDRYPFLIKVDGRLAGLVLVKRETDISESQSVWDVAEFFIVRACRRRGIGIKVAHEVWKMFPGSWQVRVMESNHAAVNFWQHAIASFIGDVIHPSHIEKNSERWSVFAFEGKQSA